MSELDRDRVAKLLAVAGSSAHEGEARNAIQLADRLIRGAGMTWADLLAPFRQLEIASEAAAVLLAEKQSLEAELEQLRSTGTAAAAWQDVGATVTDVRRAARWALELHQDSQMIWLSPWEVKFLGTCSQWKTVRLTPKMRPIFQQIMDRVVERTGMAPPV